MRKTLNEMRAELTNRATKARAHWKATLKEAERKLYREHRDDGLSKWDIYDLAEKDPKVIDANARLLEVCECCRIIGADIGD